MNRRVPSPPKGKKLTLIAVVLFILLIILVVSISKLLGSDLTSPLPENIGVKIIFRSPSTVPFEMRSEGTPAASKN